MFKKITRSIVSAASIASIVLTSSQIQAEKPENRDKIAISINKEVNRSLRYRNDVDSNGNIIDNWNIPSKGDNADCEDYALLKMEKLIDAGFKRENISILIFKTDAAEKNSKKNVIYIHAVLYIKDLDLILDIDKGVNKRSSKPRSFNSWSILNKASLYCEATNLTVGSHLTIKQRCS